MCDKNKELKEKDLENVTGGELGGTNEWILGTHNNHNGNALSDDDLENVGAGAAPELPAQTLKEEAYNNMFSSPEGTGQYEIHIYDNGIADHDFFIGKTKTNENE